MSIQKPMTAREKAYRKAEDEKWKNMTPAERKKARTKPAPWPKPDKTKKLPKAAGKLISKAKKKDPEEAYSKPLKGAPKGHNLKLAKAKRKKAYNKSRTA